VDSSIGVSLISSGAAIIVAFIGAWASSGRAVAAAVKPLNKTIHQHEVTIAEQGVTIAQLLEKVRELKGVGPDEDVQD
jgi:hypothetical protein